MLSLTEVFGPLIVILTKMMQDLVIFFGLFVIQLITFAAVGVLIFGDIAQYDDIQTAALMFFGYACGNFDFTIYQD